MATIKKKDYFYLKNINIEAIDKKYGLVRKSNIFENCNTK